MPVSRTKSLAAQPGKRVAGVQTNRALLHLILLSASAFLLYAFTLGDGFVEDDTAEVLQDRLIRSFANIPAFFAHSVWYFLGDQGDRYYRPLKLLAYSVEYHLFHFHPAFWHLANILINLAVVMVAYVLVKDLADRQLAFWSALWFAFHAVHVEAVAWVAAGNDLFCGLAVLLATLFYHRARSGSQPRMNHALGVALFLAGVMFKEPALVFPVVLLAYDFLYRRERLAEMVRGWRRYAPYVAAGGVYLLFRWHALGGFAPDNPKNHVTAKEMFLTVPVLVAQYVWKTLAPIHLQFWYTFAPVRSLGWESVAAAVLVAALATTPFLLRRSRPVLSFAAGWFVLFLLPALYIPKLGENVFTERYLYIPTFGFCVLAGWGSLRLLELASTPLTRRAIYAGLAALLACHAAFVLRRLPDWRDDLQLSLKTAADAPTARNLGNVGYLYNQRGRFEDSILYSQRAIGLDQGLAWAYNNLGSSYLSLGRFDEALADIQKAVQLQPDFPAYRANLASFYKSTGQWEKTVEACRAGLALEPSNHALLTLLGFALSRLGQPDPALDAYRRAIAAEPERLDAYIDLATNLYRLGQLDAAVAQLLAGLNANPDSEDAYLVHYQLAAIYAKQGLSQMAAAEFQRVRDLKPDFASRAARSSQH